MRYEVQIRARVANGVGPPEPVRGVDIDVPDATDGDAAAAIAVTEYARALCGVDVGDAARLAAGIIEGALIRRVRLMRIALAGSPATLSALEDQFARLADDVGIKDFRA